MSYFTSPLTTFSLSLGMRAHQQAQRFRAHHASAMKAQQVYLNTLAAIAGRDYLAMMGYESELGYCYQPIQQTLLNCADVVIDGYGRIECRYCLAGEHDVYIPPEVWSDRLGYLIVQLDESLRDAQILGFVTSVSQERISLEQLSPLDNLPGLLTSSRVETGLQTVTQLQCWFQDIQDGWQLIQQSLDLFLAAPELAYRGQLESAEQPEVGRSKSITLNHLGEPLALSIFLGLRSQGSSETDIWVKVRANQGSLPTQLRMSILTPDQAEVMSAQSNGTEAMQFRFSALPGEQFRLQLTLNESTWQEDFRV